MPCLVVVLALISPRLALVAVWLLSNWLERAFDGWLLPVLGFLLLPWTTLTYSGMWMYGTNEVAGFEWAVVAFAFLLDLGALGGSRRRGD